jgi:ribose transport system ATP-binding protein
MDASSAAKDILVPGAAVEVSGKQSLASFPLLAMHGIGKSFGTTRAVRDVDFKTYPAEIVGLMGGNGAGKTTLMKIAGGLLPADAGEIHLMGSLVDATYHPRDAMRLGLRFVHQEFSLCPNLRVFENFSIEFGDLVSGIQWRSLAIEYAQKALDEVFPGNDIDPRTKVSSLSLSQRQMVEVARGAAHPKSRIVILDEPTSSLGTREAGQLKVYMKRRRNEGVTFIFISHRLHETLDLADRIVVMGNGAVVWSGRAKEISQDNLLGFLGGSHQAPAEESGHPAVSQTNILAQVTKVSNPNLHNVSLRLSRGEIVGLAGLEGSGQRSVLQAIFEACRSPNPGIAVHGRVAYVSGDRVNEGVFPLWSIEDNIAVSSLARLGRWGLLSLEQIRRLATHWFDRLQIRALNPLASIASLSGGNQQKVVIARALATQADIMLLDDPTRGVDLGTKSDLYRIFRGFATEGRALLWYSTDDAEFGECDRTLVMRNGAVVAEFDRPHATSDRLIEASFRQIGETGPESKQKRESLIRLKSYIPTLIPLVTFALVFLLCASKSPVILSHFGLTLVFSAAFALSFAATSQLFMIAAGDIDLGIGPFIGLVNAVAATWLISDPWLAAVCFIAMLATYPVMGLFIQLRGVPAIIVTLGMSFVWLGLASYRLPRAGGSSPDWLVDVLALKTPFFPMAVYLCILPPVAAYLILMVWRYGTVLRGFGANPRAIEAAGWSVLAAKAVLFGFAGVFAFLAGIVITASTRGGDPTGAVSMTLLSVAAVILGGAAFSGGIVAPIGALFGTLTLVLVGTLLSLFEVNGVFLPLVQGMMLLGVVGVRTILMRRTT